MGLDPVVLARLEPFCSVGWDELLSDPALRDAYDEAFAQPAGYEPPDVAITNATVEGPIGPFGVRVYAPPTQSSGLPALVWAHGGGFFGGDIDMREADVVSREVCARANAVVVSVDYHRAGSRVGYPSLHRELDAAFSWTRAAADRLGVDPSRLALGGASAGANLAVAATLERRARGDVLPAALALAYPALHRRSPPRTEDAEQLAKLPAMLRFDQRSIDFMFDAYVGAATDAPYATVDGHDLAGLPPCLVVVAEYDDLRASGERFAVDAQAADVAVEVSLALGMPHGHLNMAPIVPATDASLQRLADFVASGPVGDG